MYLLLATSNSLYINVTNSQELKNIISGLKPKTSGIDEIPEKVLKSTPEIYCMPYLMFLIFH